MTMQSVGNEVRNKLTKGKFMTGFNGSESKSLGRPFFNISTDLINKILKLPHTP